MLNFEEVIDLNLQKLETYTPIVARVHGKENPEFLEVQKEIDKIVKKIKDKNYDLDQEFKEVRKITNDYTIPPNVCETYVEVYSMVLELDQTYNKDKK